MAYADLDVFLCTIILIFQGAAIYHDDIRDELIAEKRGIYRYGRQSGPKANDVTCFHNFKGQQNWETAREQWPEILYHYESKGETRTGRKAEPWVREGKLVLDINDDPVLAFKELPATISSKCEPAMACTLDQKSLCERCEAR
ncbi:hypothetical protein MMC14_000882 [Varicellaria rhodocarpa]|nr:hypothetical protein [Varicellaria rhodocarpa]